ncbi:hypothetical protein [Streptosporangium sp. NPDC023615]|uniref:hypothetical protein n=1 Tax=Streptosporangium sp. NPDC023615 TaxID=3154794 RepID=UPI003442F042
MDVQLLLGGAGVVALMAVGATYEGGRRLRERRWEAMPESHRVERVRRMQEEQQARRVWQRRQQGRWRVY